MLKLIIHLIFLLNYTINITYSLNDEGLALLSFKNSIIKDPLGSLTNWNTTDETPCTWNGITCKQERVTSISIPRKQLYGILYFTLFTLPSLRHVNLRNNALFGNLPPQLYHAQGLQSLVLSDNSLSGSLSNDVGKLQNLINFDLSRNLFNGSLPVSIVECRKLKYLVLSNNNLSGSLPNGIGNGLVLLQKLDFSKNKFDGSIPSDLGKLSNLEGTLDLSNNSFSGSIPSSLGDLPEEVYIDLSYNNLSGSIPQNGALINRGPTAFIGNPNLCGPPLKIVCSSNSTTISPSSYPNLPSEDPRSDNVGKKNGKVLSRSGLVAIIVCDIVGICLIGWLFSCCYMRFCSGCKSKDEKGIRKKRNGGCCFRKPESETMSENAEQYELVPLDSMVTFDLDELLKATAFVIGKSGVGIMYKVVLEDGLTLAVRRLGEGGSQWFKEFETEVEAIGKIRHPNIVTLRAYYWSVDEKLLIYDYVPNGSLASALHGNPGMSSFTPLPWSIRVKIMKGIARGIVYLHEFSPKKYIHGALNPSNILLGPNMEAKIADFGLGRLANITGGTLTLQRQSQSNTAPSEAGSITTTNAITYYQAPESLKPVKPSQKWDVYSFGVILLEMITGLSPLVQASATGMDLVQWVQHCIQENKPLADVLDPYLSQEVDIDDDEDEIVHVLKIAMACVHCLPEKRPPMRHVSDVLERLYESSP